MDPYLGFSKALGSLRQRDPLWPYLFMLAMEALSCLHERARKGGHLLSFTMRSKGGKGAKVSHMLFTNDT